MQGCPTVPFRALRSPDLWRDALALALCVAGLLFLYSAVNVLPDSRGWGYDFTAYYHAALRLVDTGTPYQAETLAGPFRPGPGGLYLYSPIPALLVVPLTWLEEELATWAWALGHIALLVVACWLLPMSRRLRLALIGVAGLSLVVIIDFQLGNVSLIVTCLTMIAWRFLDRPAGAAAIVLAMTMRPTMGLLLAWWAVRRRWQPLAWALAAGAALVLLSVPFLGVGPYLDFVAVLGNLSNVTGVPNNIDLATTAWRLRLPEWAVGGALYAGYALAIGASLLSLRRDRELSFVVVAMATLFLSPLLWDHYLAQLLIPAAFLAKRGHAWGLLLPLLGWAPAVGLKLALPLIGLIGMLTPFVAPDRGEPALAGAVEADDIAMLDAAVGEGTGR
jgi:hypothetical protein